MSLEKRVEKIEQILADKAEGNNIQVVIINLPGDNGIHTEPSEEEIAAKLEQLKKEGFTPSIPTLEWLSSEGRFR